MMCTLSPRVGATEHAFAVPAEATPFSVIHGSAPHMVRLTDSFIPEDDGVYVVLLQSGSALPCLSSGAVLDTWTESACSMQYPPFQISASASNWGDLDISGIVRVVSPFKSRRVVKEKPGDKPEGQCGWRVEFDGRNMLGWHEDDPHEWPLQIVAIHGIDESTATGNAPNWVARTISLFVQQTKSRYPGPFVLKVPHEKSYAEKRERMRFWYHMRQESGAGMFDVEGSFVGTPHTFLVAYAPSQKTGSVYFLRGQPEPIKERPVKHPYAVPDDDLMDDDATIHRFKQRVTGTLVCDAKTSDSVTNTIICESDKVRAWFEMLQQLQKVGYFTSGLQLFRSADKNAYDTLLQAGGASCETPLPMIEKPVIVALVQNFDERDYDTTSLIGLDLDTAQKTGSPIVHVVFVCQEIQSKVLSVVEIREHSNLQMAGFTAILATAITTTPGAECTELLFVVDTATDVDPAYWYTDMSAYKPALLLLAAGGTLVEGPFINETVMISFSQDPEITSTPKSQFRGSDRLKPFYRRATTKSGPNRWLTQPRQTFLNHSKAVSDGENSAITEYCKLLDEREAARHSLWGPHIKLGVDDSISIASAAMLRGLRPHFPPLPPAPCHTPTYCDSGLNGLGVSPNPLAMSVCDLPLMGTPRTLYGNGNDVYPAFAPTAVDTVRGMQEQISMLQAALNSKHALSTEDTVRNLRRRSDWR